MRDYNNDVPQPSYGEMRDKITLDDIHSSLCPATIESVDMRDMAPARSRKPDYKIIMTFHEFPGKEYIANATSYKTCVEQLGKDWRSWVNRVVVLDAVTNTFDNVKTTKVHVAAPGDWAAALAAARDASTKKTSRRK